MSRFTVNFYLYLCFSCRNLTRMMAMVGRPPGCCVLFPFVRRFAEPYYGFFVCVQSARRSCVCVFVCAHFACSAPATSSRLNRCRLQTAEGRCARAVSAGGSLLLADRLTGWLAGWMDGWLALARQLAGRRRAGRRRVDQPAGLRPPANTTTTTDAGCFSGGVST